MKEQVIKSIEKRNLINFYYDGNFVEVEPYPDGYNPNDTRMSTILATVK